MLGRRATQSALAVIGSASAAAFAWAVKTQLDASVGPSGLQKLGSAVGGVVSDAIDNAPASITMLTGGLLAGFLISGMARSIDVRLKSDERWSTGMLRREVRFARWLCRWSWLRFLAQDMPEDLRMLSHQLVLRGLPAIPTSEPADAKAFRSTRDYLDVIQPHLTDDGMPYALACALRFAEERDAKPPVPKPVGQPRRVPDAAKARKSPIRSSARSRRGAGEPHADEKR